MGGSPHMGERGAGTGGASVRPLRARLLPPVRDWISDACAAVEAVRLKVGAVIADDDDRPRVAFRGLRDVGLPRVVDGNRPAEY